MAALTAFAGPAKGSSGYDITVCRDALPDLPTERHRLHGFGRDI